MQRLGCMRERLWRKTKRTKRSALWSDVLAFGLAVTVAVPPVLSYICTPTLRPHSNPKPRVQTPCNDSIDRILLAAY